MNRIYIKDLKEHFNEEITISGFVSKIRDMQYVQFVVIRDITGKVQVTIEKNDENKELNEIVSNTTLESTIIVKGTALENEKVKLGGIEILPKDITLTSNSLNELPFDYNKKDNSLRETRLDYRFIDLRREDNNLFFKVETLFEHALREYYIENDFMEIHSPKIAAKAAESGAEVFNIDYFGEPATLSQSPQFYKQMAMASNFDKVFEIGPAFRAENSHTSYHATEINMLDTEISFIESVDDVMDFQENSFKYAFKKVFDKYKDEMVKFYNVKDINLDVKFPRITFAEAKQILKDKYNFVSERDDDFERKEENLLCQYAKEKYGSDFVFITKFPFSARPFYHMLDEDGLTNSYDLLFKGIEITTGAQREHRHDILRSQIIKKEMDPAELEFYLDFFKYGCPPHGGYGCGIARIMMMLFDFDNIREATFIYRGPNRLKP